MIISFEIWITEVNIEKNFILYFVLAIRRFLWNPLTSISWIKFVKYIKSQIFWLQISYTIFLFFFLLVKQIPGCLYAIIWSIQFLTTRSGINIGWISIIRLEIILIKWFQFSYLLTLANWIFFDILDRSLVLKYIEYTEKIIRFDII